MLSHDRYLDYIKELSLQSELNLNLLKLRSRVGGRHNLETKSQNQYKKIASQIRHMSDLT